MCCAFPGPVQHRTAAEKVAGAAERPWSSDCYNIRSRVIYAQDCMF